MPNLSQARGSAALY